jgi:hypothetical protein
LRDATFDYCRIKCDNWTHVYLAGRSRSENQKLPKWHILVLFFMGVILDCLFDNIYS